MVGSTPVTSNSPLCCRIGRKGRVHKAEATCILTSFDPKVNGACKVKKKRIQMIVALTFHQLSALHSFAYKKNMCGIIKDYDAIAWTIRVLLIVEAF